MNKIINGLLVTALAMSANVYATTHRNKTFLMPRSQGVNLALEHTAGWTELLSMERESGFGGNVQVMGFFSQSSNDKDLARYFSCGKNCSTPSTNCNTNCNTSCNTDCNTTTNCNTSCKDGIRLTFGENTLNTTTGKTGDITQDLDGRRFVHDSETVGSASEVATLDLSMEHESYGATFVYQQDINLGKCLKGLYFKMTLPIVHVENDVKACWAGTGSDDLKKYFAGEYCSSTAQDAQNKLQYLTFGSKCPDNSATGVADIDLMLGYKFNCGECFSGSINFGVTVPTSDEPKSRSLFEAVIGNGGHVAIGAGFEGGMKAWGDDEHNIKFHAALNYRFLFESGEKRVLGLADPNATTSTSNNTCSTSGCNTSSSNTSCNTACDAICWGHYYVLGNADCKTLEPAANLLAQRVDVEPGSQVDAIISAWYNRCGFSFNVGYNLYYREEECIKLRNCAIFKKNTYGIPRQDFRHDRMDAGGADTPSNPALDIINSAKFGAKVTDFDGVGNVTTGEGNNTDNKYFLSDSNVVKSTAQTPRQLSHKIYAGLAYTWTKWENPFMVGLGGHYEFKDSNSVIENWGIHGKIGMSF